MWNSDGTAGETLNGSGIWDMGYGMWDLRYGIWDLGFGIWDFKFQGFFPN